MAALSAAGAAAEAAYLTPIGAAIDAPDSAAEAMAAFVVDTYAVVGRRANGSPYTGGARITRGAGVSLDLVHTVDGVTRMVAGRVEVPHPPGEGLVVRFDGPEAQQRTTCLVHGDLDDRPRLTCTVTSPDKPTPYPGIEAWFSASEWGSAPPARPRVEGAKQE